MVLARASREIFPHVSPNPLQTCALSEDVWSKFPPTSALDGTFVFLQPGVTPVILPGWLLTRDVAIPGRRRAQLKKRPVTRVAQNQAGRRFSKMAARRNHGPSMRRRHLPMVPSLAIMRLAYWRALAEFRLSGTKHQVV